MRKTWIAVAAIAVLAGAAAIYGLGRPGKLEPVSAPSKPSDRTDSIPPASDTTAIGSPLPAGEATAAGGADANAVADPPAVLESRPLPRVPVSAANGPGSAPTPTPTSAPAPTATPTPTPTPTPMPMPRPAPPPVPAAVTGSVPPGASTRETEAAAETSAPIDDPESDRRPPVLEILRFDPPEVKDGGTALLSVGTTDDLSGVKFVSGSVRSPSGAAMIPFSARDLSGGGVFSAAIVIPARGETGDWFVANLQIVDKAENPLTMSFVRASVPDGGALRVVSDESDSAAPSVLRVSVAKGSVDAGESNQIVVEVEDDRSGVAQVTGAFQSPTKAAFIPFACRHDGESPTWEGIVPVPENADCGEWKLRQLRVVDKANNSSFLSMDAPQVGSVSFLVAGGGCDAEAPTLEALDISPAYVSNASAAELVVTIRAHDAGSGVASVSGWIDGPIATNGQAPRIHFNARPDPGDEIGPMTARITVPQFAAKGVWRVTLAQLSDKARNTRAYTREDEALRDAAFTVE